MADSTPSLASAEIAGEVGARPEAGAFAEKAARAGEREERDKRGEAEDDEWFFHGVRLSGGHRPSPLVQRRPGNLSGFLKKPDEMFTLVMDASGMSAGIGPC